MSLDLPADFVKNVTVSFPGGADWLSRLPGLLDETVRRWRISLGAPFPLSYNYVCEAWLEDGTPAVLKAGVPNPELTSEINALRLYNGQGACCLLEADSDKGLLLLEHLYPGRMLVTLDDDDLATGIAAEVMKKIHRSVSRPEKFILLKDWFDKLQGVRVLFHGGTGPFPPESFALAESLIRELFSEDRPQILMHGDFHHFNILSSVRGWLVIDPKGVVGPAEYEVGPLLINPMPCLPPEGEAIRRTQKRIAIRAERLGFEPERMRAWAICHSVLSAFWDMDESGSGGEISRAWTEIFIRTKV